MFLNLCKYKIFKSVKKYFFIATIVGSARNYKTYVITKEPLARPQAMRQAKIRLRRATVVILVCGANVVVFYAFKHDMVHQLWGLTTLTIISVGLDVWLIVYLVRGLGKSNI